MQPLQLIGFASGIAANNPGCQTGPGYLLDHPELFSDLPFKTEWQPIIHATSELRGLAVLPQLTTISTQLAQQVYDSSQKQQPFCVIGGDHSCGIGTWSGVAHAYRAQGDIGLLWIDAHLDSHTPETSKSQNIHGMPVSHLLGHGIPALCHLLDQQPKLKPENLCFIGIRSFEEGEAELVRKWGIKVFNMADIARLGMPEVMRQAIAHISRNTCGVGITIDLDGIDPQDAPGVGCREPGGIYAADLMATLPLWRNAEKPLLGLEIAEFNPARDKNQQTAKWLVKIIEAVYSHI